MDKLIFVYGTLKQGFPNHKLNRGIRVEGDFVTLKKYPLYLVGERHSPWLMNSPGTGEHIFGEVYTVDKNTLLDMDILERVDEADGYSREIISVVDLRMEQVYEVNAYLHTQIQFDTNTLKSGPLKRYELEHAKFYRRRSKNGH